MDVCLHPRRHCGKPPHDTPKYGLLFAAQAGCLQCVKYWIEDMGVDVRSTSDNHHDWDVESYARWGTSPGKMSVLQYLQFQKERDLPLHPQDEEVASPVRSSASVHRPLPPIRFLPCTNMHIHSVSHLWVDRLAGAA